MRAAAKKFTFSTVHLIFSPHEVELSINTNLSDTDEKFIQDFWSLAYLDTVFENYVESLILQNYKRSHFWRQNQNFLVIFKRYVA